MVVVMRVGAGMEQMAAFRGCGAWVACTARVIVPDTMYHAIFVDRPAAPDKAAAQEVVAKVPELGMEPKVPMTYEVKVFITPPVRPLQPLSPPGRSCRQCRSSPSPTRAPLAAKTPPNYKRRSLGRITPPPSPIAPKAPQPPADKSLVRRECAAYNQFPTNPHSWGQGQGVRKMRLGVPLLPLPTLPRGLPLAIPAATFPSSARHGSSPPSTPSSIPGDAVFLDLDEVAGNLDWECPEEVVSFG